MMTATVRCTSARFDGTDRVWGDLTIEDETRGRARGDDRRSYGAGLLCSWREPGSIRLVRASRLVRAAWLACHATRSADRLALSARPLLTGSAGSCDGGRGALHRRGLVVRVLLVPAGVAGSERRRAEAVGKDRQADGQVDREHDQMLVGKVRLLDHDHGEHDRGQSAGTEPAEEAERRRPGS